MKCFEILWYEEEDGMDDYITKEFSTYQAMINFYNKHKAAMYDVLLTRRSTADWHIIEDYPLSEA